MPKISVIMPSLNVVKYIRPCIESVLEQTLDDIEIICVDAGSTDGTLEILNEYAQNDKRVRVVISEKRSYGYQMNLGFSLASGEYIGIVETDDYIEKDMYKTLYDLACKTDADYIKGGRYNFEYIGKIELRESVFQFESSKYDKNGMVIIENDTTGELLLKDYYVWTGIYKADFVKGIKFNETPGAAYQDIGFLAQVFINSKKAIYLNKAFYHYRQDNTGASCYNKNAFRFLVEEYDYTDKHCAEQSNEFKFRLNCKMYRQMYLRMLVMAYSGEIWENAVEYLKIIRGRIKNLIDEDNKITGVLSVYEENVIKEFNENILSLYEKEKSNADISKKLSDEFFEKMPECDEIVIFGAGNYGRAAHLLLEMNGYNVCVFCDNSDKLQGKTLQSAGIISPKEATEKYPEAVYVIANKNYKDEIREQLINSGINKENIIEYNVSGVNKNLLRKLRKEGE